jgi:acetyl esterase/lipase
MSADTLAQAIEWEQQLSAAIATATGLEEVRATNERFMRDRAGQLPDDVRVEHVDAGGVPSEWVDTGADEGPVVFFLHGGGLMMGAPLESREFLGRLTRETGGRALAVDYCLAPEHAYPAAADDARAAYHWLLAQGCDPRRVVVVGESAGGLLAVALLVALRDAGDPLPAAAVTLSPLVDMTLSAESLDANADSDPLVDRAGLTMMMEAVLQGKDAVAASPLNADLTGLPPLLVQVGTAEAIYDDPRRLAEKATAAGVEVTFEPWEEMIHLWHGFPKLPQAHEATTRIAEHIKKHTAGAVGRAPA